MRVLQSKTLLTLFLLLLCLSSFAQTKSDSKAYIQKKMEMVTIEENLKSADFFTSRKAVMGLGIEDEMILKTTISGKNNYTYEKYEQHYKGVPVFGSAYTLRIQNGLVKRTSGYYLPLVDLSVEPKISAKEAVELAKDEMQAKLYVWEDETMKKIPGYSQKPEANLIIIDAAYPSSSESYKLAYQVDLHSTEPLDKKRFFVDAQNGNIFLDLPLLMHQDYIVPGKGQCKYYGEQEFSVLALTPDIFHLRDFSRGGNTVFNGEDGSLYWRSDNYWGLNEDGEAEVAVDAHFCTEKFHDFMLNTFGWEGLDNEGREMNSVVHAGDFVNAFWDGLSASFGDGDCNRGPLTTFELVGHEFMHGITDHSSNLIYQNESGAINESMSDIFGKALEYYEDPDNFEWTVGHSFLETPYARPFRSFEDPNQFSHPKLYKGEYWGDFGFFVHTNSSVGNHWFYLLVNGGAGMNEEGTEYNIQGIGMEKALQLVFLTQTTALTPNSTYPFYCLTSTMIAEEIFGEGSLEALDVQEAWKAVGIIASEIEGILSLDINVDVRFNVTCLNNEFFDFEFSISNIGDLPYLTSMEGVVELMFFDENNDVKSKMLSLDDEILPGESISFSVPDLVFLKADGFTYLDIYLYANNADFTDALFLLFLNTANERNDLSISNSNANLDPLSNCFGAESEFSVSVTNASCNTISAGTAFDLSFYDEDDELILNRSYQLPIDLLSSSSYSVPDILDLSAIESEFIKIELDYIIDVNNENNSIIINVPKTKSINSQFLETFDSEIFENINVNIGSSNGAIEFSHPYQNENYIAVTGSDIISDDSFCPNPEDYFENEKVTLQACISTENLQNPILSFDLVQFRNEAAIEFSELRDFANIVKVTWTDGQNDFEDFIFGQAEGELVNHEYDLPENANGIASIEFSLNTGNHDFNDLLSSDISLLDNFSISGVLTSVSETNTPQFEINPNPTTGIISLKYTEIPDALVVRNITGQEVLRLSKFVNLQELDIRHLPQGIYPVTLIYGDNTVSRLISKVNE